MKTKKYITLLNLLFWIGIRVFSQDVRFIALGDLHFDRLIDHDWKYVMTRPQDFKQIMEEYPQHTAVYLEPFLQLIKGQALTLSPSVKAVAQLGDLVEGVAGTDFLARQMVRGVVDLLYSIQLPVPWILVKGNHDVSNSPGQPEAWREVIKPFIERQIGQKIDNGMYSYKISDDVEIFVLEQFFSNDINLPESEIMPFLESRFEKSTASYKFVLTHQPVIPVSERCWHLMSNIRRPVQDSTLRNRFLNLLGKNKAIILCAHLHKFSVLSRQTTFGPIVQIMINSVNKGFDSEIPEEMEREYKGGEWVISNLEWQPYNQEFRFKILEEEKKHVKNFLRVNIPGYCVLSIYPEKQKVLMNHYNGFSTVPFQTFNITEMQQ